MKVTSLATVTARPRRVAVGSFDGVHIGHQAVIAGCDTVLTFEPHPLAVLTPHAAPYLLTDRETRLDRLAALGVAEVVLIPFDHQVAAQPARDFVDDVLVDLLRARQVSVGANFRFGAGAAGHVATLAADDRFTTRVTPLRTVAGEVVSSTWIRRLVAAGEVEDAAALLSRALTLRAECHHQPSTGNSGSIRLDFDPRAAVPGDGDYECVLGGTPATIHIRGHVGRLRWDTDSRLPRRSVVAVEFHRRSGDHQSTEHSGLLASMNRR